MPTLNIQKARQLGFTDQQIQQHLAQNPGLGVSGAQTPTPQSGGITDWLPTIGSIVGGIGGGATLGPVGAIGGSAVGGGAGEWVRQLLTGQKTDLGSIGKEAALGGIAGGVGEGLGPAFKGARALIGGGAKAGAEVAGETAGRAGTKAVAQTTQANPNLVERLGQVVKAKAAQSVMNTSPSSFRNAADVGVDINNAYSRHAPFLGNSFDEMLGPIGKNVAPELKGGNISNRIKMFEGQIQNVVKEAGTVTKISGDKIVKGLRQELANEKMVLGNDARVSLLENLIKQSEKQYKNGITVGNALKKLRLANRQFGKSILEDQTGSMISSAQKLEANTLRSQLKSLFPTSIGTALDNEQELIILREVLGGARSKTAAGSLGVSGLDITKPGTVLQFLLGSPQVGNKAIQAGNVIERAGGFAGKVAPIVGQTAVQTGAQTGVRALFNPQQQPDQTTPTSDFTQPTDTAGATSDFTGNNDAKIKQAFSLAMLANPKNAATLKTIYDFGFAPQGAGANVGKITAKDYALAQSGLKNVQDVSQIYQKDPSVLTKQLVPGQFLSRKFDSAVYDAFDTLLRLRTGAQANPTEIRGYMQKLGPAFGDSADVVKYKLDKLRSDLEFYSKGGGSADFSALDAPSTLSQFGE